MERTVFIAYYQKNGFDRYTVDLGKSLREKVFNPGKWAKMRKIIYPKDEIFNLEYLPAMDKAYLLDKYLEEIEKQVSDVVYEIETSGILMPIFLFIPSSFMEQQENLVFLIRRSTNYLIHWNIELPNQICFPHPLLIEENGGKYYFGINENIFYEN